MRRPIKRKHLRRNLRKRKKLKSLKKRKRTSRVKVQKNQLPRKRPRKAKKRLRRNLMVMAKLRLSQKMWTKQMRAPQLLNQKNRNQLNRPTWQKIKKQKNQKWIGQSSISLSWINSLHSYTNQMILFLFYAVTSTKSCNSCSWSKRIIPWTICSLNKMERYSMVYWITCSITP